MDIVDNVDGAQPTEEEVIPKDSVVGQPYTAETFEEEWQRTYMHLTETLRRVYEQVSVGIQAEMETQIPDFDLENEDHNNLFERSVTAKVIDIGAQAEIMGMLKAALVVYLNVAKRYGFESKNIKASLDLLTEGQNANENVEKFKQEMSDGSEIHEPVHPEEQSS